MESWMPRVPLCAAVSWAAEKNARVMHERPSQKRTNGDGVELSPMPPRPIRRIGTWISLDRVAVPLSGFSISVRGDPGGHVTIRH